MGTLHICLMRVNKQVTGLVDHAFGCGCKSLSGSNMLVGEQGDRLVKRGRRKSEK